MSTTQLGSASPLRRRRSGRSAIDRRNRRVVAHSALVRPIALHYCRCTPEPLEDLVQAGLLGLIRAAELYVRQQGTPFEAFARPHIRGAILHHLRDAAPAVRLPRRQAELQERLLRLQRASQGSSAPLLALQLRALGIDAAQASLLLRQRQLNRPQTLLPEHEQGEMRAAWEQPGLGTPPLGQAELPGEGARAMLACLPERERLVVEQVVLAGLSYRQLAERLEVSTMTVQRLFQRGLNQLRKQHALQAGQVSRPAVYPARSAAQAC